MCALLLAAAFPCRGAEPAALTAQEGSGTSPFSLLPLDYEPGRGVRIGTTGLAIGGFTNIKAEDTDASGGEFALDTLNFFLIFDRFSRFRAVAELELDDVFVANDSETGAQDFAFNVRRLFGDYTVADEFHVRLGTFLTPVGYWNLILAPPLTWTTEPPLIVEETFFQQTTTGAMVHGSTNLARGQVGYAVFAQFLDPLEDNPDLKPPEHTAGARVTYDSGLDLELGMTYQGSQSSDGWSQLGAVHAFWLLERGELLSEAYVQDGGNLSSLQWGTYLQGVLDVYGPLHLVGRFEHYAPPSPDTNVQVFTVGMVVKPVPFMAIKGEYRAADGRPPDEESLNGFYFSFATFF